MPVSSDWWERQESSHGASLWAGRMTAVGVLIPHLLKSCPRQSVCSASGKTQAPPHRLAIERFIPGSTAR